MRQSGAEPHRADIAFAVADFADDAPPPELLSRRGAGPGKAVVRSRRKILDHHHVDGAALQQIAPGVDDPTLRHSRGDRRASFPLACEHERVPFGYAVSGGPGSPSHS